MKQILIPDELYDKLIGLANEYINQNNRFQADPFYFNIEDEVSYMTKDGCGDYKEYRSDSETAISSIEDIENHLDCDNIHQSEAYQKLIANKPDFDSYEFSEFMNDYFPDFEEIEYKKEKIYKNCFLLSKTCDQHIRLNHYHYSKTARSYADTAWRNPDMEIIVNLLRSIGDTENGKN